MWVRDADPDEAQRLGVTGKPDPKEMQPLDAPITVDVPPNLSPEMLDSMMASLGDRAVLKDGQITVRSALSS